MKHDKKKAREVPCCDTKDLEELKQDIRRHVVASTGHDSDPPRPRPYYQGLAYSVRQRLVERWIRTQRSYYDSEAKRVYYLSLEFLPGRFLMSSIINLGMEELYRKAVADFGLYLDSLAEMESDPGLGNGGLGRLASCYLDSMASLRVPGYGYGIRYDYGIFQQQIKDGHQVEKSDDWLEQGTIWEFKRPESMYEIKFYGRSEAYTDDTGSRRFRWVDTRSVMAMACDYLIPGYRNDNVINMRLWSAKSSREFDLNFFNVGNYIGAVEEQVHSETISKVLYPSDLVQENQELRLKQQYFFVSATFQDIMRRSRKRVSFLHELPDKVAIHLNDTHPAIGIPELMRLLMDEEGLGWDEAWSICERTFAFTNHTLLPEALETWPVELLGRVLPRHLEIIYEINQRFLNMISQRFPGRPDIVSRLSLIQEAPQRRVRMAHLAILGSHSVNGVSELHTQLLKERVFKEFDEIFPGRLQNVTNGITPRRWLLQANPRLASCITQTIGEHWITGLHKLEELVPYASDPEFQSLWREVKLENKHRLAKYIQRTTGTQVNVDSLFDVHIKRIHEYKRQLMNILHVITLYRRLITDPRAEMVPRTVIFAGKAAPGYRMAKLIIKLINNVAAVVNHDPRANGLLKVVFLPNYCVSQAERILPGADLSEQISTAGMEASGTGNMKFALNDALTIGTLDGANIEMLEEVGPENMFIFGLTAEDVTQMKAFGYMPYTYYQNDPELQGVLDMISANVFSADEPGIFAPIREALLKGGDPFMVLADYRDYLRAQEEVGKVFVDPAEWTRRSILNTAKMGKFSSDRAVLEYATKIWNITPLYL